MDSGTIKFFDPRVSNFGFIVPDKTGPEVFLHGNAVPDHLRKDLTDGRRVKYRVEPDKRGRPRATYVELAPGYGEDDPSPGYGRPIKTHH